MNDISVMSLEELIDLECPNCFEFGFDRVQTPMMKGLDPRFEYCITIIYCDHCDYQERELYAVNKKSSHYGGKK
jgi:C4-type Zn-finger protein